MYLSFELDAKNLSLTIKIKENNIKNIDSIIKYVKSKGYEIVFLNELLNENMC